MEQWKEIPGYDGKYEVSTYGNVRCVNYRRSGKSQNMKLSLSHHNYYMVTLRQQGKNVNRSVHRLVAITWIPNPKNLPEIDHINSNPSDNRIENLRWCTKEENYKNPATIAKRRNRKGTKGAYSKNPITDERRKEISLTLSKPVIQMDLFRRYINEYPSIKIAGEVTKVHYTAINKCCRGKAKSAGGYKWKYK